MEPIKGYRDLSADEIALINRIKELGGMLETCVNDLRHNEHTDKRWVSIGATDCQTGLMALVRSVAQPTTF